MDDSIYMTKNTINTIKKHGIEKCRDAYRLNREDGEGPSTIGIYLGVKTNTAHALINAGRELAQAPAMLVGDRYIVLKEQCIDPEKVFLVQTNDEGYIFQCPCRWDEQAQAYVVTGFGWNNGHIAKQYPAHGKLVSILRQKGFQFTLESGKKS